MKFSESCWIGWFRGSNRGGLIVYCTCSLEPAEGEYQSQAFLERQAGKVELVAVDPEEIGGLGESVTSDGYLRCLPCHDAGPDGSAKGMDGFFAARFKVS